MGADGPACYFSIDSLSRADTVPPCHVEPNLRLPDCDSTSLLAAVRIFFIDDVDLRNLADRMVAPPAAKPTNFALPDQFYPIFLTCC